MIRQFMRRSLGAPLAIAALVFATGSNPVQAASATIIAIKNFHFMPMAMTVPAGGAVTWKNMDGEPHTVTSVDGLFRSGALDQNDSFTFKFAKPGTYKYVCSIHPKMVATITVK